MSFKASKEEVVKAVESLIGWNISEPFLVSNDRRTIMVFNLVNELDWNDPSAYSDHDDEIVIIEFPHCMKLQFGSPNVEIRKSHRLWDKGLESYGVFHVENSTWIMELDNQSQIHPLYSQGKLKNKKHFVFCLEDSTFECISDEFIIRKEKYDSRVMEGIFREVSQRSF
ncbi:hypothetical protein [Mechercharimyces sp. CAU 1602]|uniref:hypothetical protein n=1 Tax=Mechercharimyces sp. CAU 1602 TaxID=2973933 RepID=UPI002163AAA1|nr:hypothetical protein [Mechercharimyces sp. CAU 1602]MCS1350872.1 hypothetical protein [Mechercharimyces sp. CAU 1602]